jgi:hypothetical protein
MRDQGRGPASSACAKEADGFAALGGLLVEKIDVPHGVGGLFRGRIRGIDRAASGRLAGVGLDELPSEIEADKLLIGSRVELFADKHRGQRVGRLGDLGAMIGVAAHAAIGQSVDPRVECIGRDHNRLGVVRDKPGRCRREMPKPPRRLRSRSSSTAGSTDRRNDVATGPL